jgi:hypothetical protein
MSNKHILYASLAFSAFVIGLHMIAHTFYLYWIYRWVDIPMHILGGVMAGFYSALALRVFGYKEKVVLILIGVVIVGIAWELLELYFKVDTLNFRYWIDTTKDLVNDTIGGIIAIYIWRKIPNRN